MPSRAGGLAAYYTYVPAQNAIAADALAMETHADFAGIVADEVEAISAGGARAPLSVLHR